MPSLQVICPKCVKGQQVAGEIPPGGVDHVCVFCKTLFRARPQTRSDTSDLPVSREAMPRPGDLPVDRISASRTADLRSSRSAGPRPIDLPATRESTSSSRDLPVAKAPSFGPNLPVFAERPDFLPVAKPPSVGPRLPTSHSERAASKTPPLGLALELSFGQVPEEATEAASYVPISPPSSPASPRSGPLGFVLEDTPFPDILAPASPPQAPPPRIAPPNLRQPPADSDQARPAVSLPQRRTKTAPLPLTMPPIAFPPLAQPGATPPAPLPLPPNLTEPDFAPPPQSSATTAAGMATGVDLGFSLELEGHSGLETDASAIPFPGVRVASEGLAEAVAATKDELPALAPPTSRASSASRALRSVAKKHSFPRWIYFALGGVAALVLAAVLVLPLLRRAPDADAVLQPFQLELAKDNASAYPRGAEELIRVAATFKEGGDKLRLRAAELLLLAQTLHGGEPAAIARAGEILQGVAAQPKLEPALLRGRALLAVAKGRSREAEGLLSTANSAESQLVLGLARLSDSKATAAVEPLRKYVAARPQELAGHYLLGKALAVGSPVQARAEFELVRAQNPTHGGAAVALARLEETPEKRLAAARALIDKKPKEIGRTELGDLSLLLGESAQAIGHTSEAKDAFQRAITQDNHLLAAHLALGEALLYEGKNSQALERMKAAGPALEGSPSGKFGLGGALLATGQTAQGLALVNAAATERPGDARESYWQGFASTLEQPSDWTAAEQSYREAIKRDPKFLPASLQLAALLQQHGKAEDSLAVLRAAEEAGAPLPVLQLAWGEALLVAKEPSKAEEAFRKALAADATLISAHLGIASALEAENKLAEAKASLESAIKAAPAAPGLRERLARICLKLGENTDALSHYQEEIQAGNSTPQLRLALARTALDLGNVELAQGEAKKVLDEFPRNAEAAYTMARVYEAKNETGAALQEYRHATTWENLPAYSLGYGRLLAKIGKEHEALLALEAASSLADGRMERGRIYYRRGELESALADFQATSKLDPTAAEPHILEGLCLDKLGQPAKAEEAWREALRADPDVPEPHYRLGRQEMDRGKPALAIDHFRKAAAKAPQGAPWQAELYFQLGQAELLTGSKTAAVAAFKKYLELAPQDAPARPEATHQIAHLTGKK